MVEIFLVIALVLCLFGLLVFLALFLYFAAPMFFGGAIFVPSSNDRVKDMLDLARARPGMKMADLGSGDGKIVIAFARAGIISTGLEIDPLLVSKSRKIILKQGLEDKAFIVRRNFWRQNFSEFDVVTVYGMFHIMPFLEKKLQKELKPGAVVISNGFQFPRWKPFEIKNGVFAYKK